MRNQLTTVRRFAVAIALTLLAAFALHPACPPEPAHHGAFTPGISGEFCRHGGTSHLSSATPAQAAVQAASVPAPVLGETSVIPAPDMTSTSDTRPSERISSGRTLLTVLGISRT
ncbi:hypothetical protein SK803_01210 [Lentzea sp. BCCO 10_0856]|uniref:Uncharacterized protein n=1 Tax=Lentzea miocenica TaxID=3095431 RepID=A0ABU4SSC5_9PSEU|nr:hypothetical protein [Lentzea sp. BCCO 10_0856]MDX8028803.1 hypothetical protein [Lentzea sp. BCCO 10_0856]